MPTMRRRSCMFVRAPLSMLGCALAVIGATCLAHAELSFPDHPIRLVVAFTPGGATDVIARQLANDIKETIGQPIVVENRPGANGQIAWTHVAGSDPDGYTLLIAENALAISQGFYRRTNFDPVRQFDAVCLVATAPLVLVTSNHVKADTLAQFVALARATPNKLSFASSGIGSVAHLVFEAFMAGAGIEAVHVPYKGGGQAIGDVLAGHIDAMTTSISVAKGLIDSHQVKGLAVTGFERSAVLPNIPTLKESGVTTANVELQFWWGIFGPAGLPDGVKTKLSNAISAVLADPQMRMRLAKLDIDPAYAPAPALQSKLVNEITNWSKFIDEHGIKAE